MNTISVLIRRNTKLFFKDKGMFFTSLVTPIILLVLYATFLGNIYQDTFKSGLPDFIKLSDDLIDSLVAGQLLSSILSVSCVTVAFASNLLMVQDKANGTIKDLKISPVRSAALSMSYYIATLLSTLIICLISTGAGLGYIATVGWYLSASDVFFLFLDVVILVLFGTAFSSVIYFFLSTQGQISAVSTIISAGYGFISGAYMPISSFSEGLQKTLSFLPGTYGTSLLRTHALKGAMAQLETEGVPAEVITSLQDSLDCNLYFFENQVSIPVMYLFLGGSTVLLVGLYILLNATKRRA